MIYNERLAIGENYVKVLSLSDVQMDINIILFKRPFTWLNRDVFRYKTAQTAGVAISNQASLMFIYMYKNSSNQNQCMYFIQSDVTSNND
ncbi:hypothetical protein DERP_001364 [Dermatophagoides pteronyssinus]|uniref:Uncharacterized protein n=1 Tax=Dermatophagoides pteronyssinus TaxID=6956 RepID=A0ABQ8JER6_DERPT|nr:hypothetical protein DERP_001364 [Dermatophagoides pteronyssinus]